MTTCSDSGVTFDFFKEKLPQLGPLPPLFPPLPLRLLCWPPLCTSWLTHSPLAPVTPLLKLCLQANKILPSPSSTRPLGPCPHLFLRCLPSAGSYSSALALVRTTPPLGAPSRAPLLTRQLPPTCFLPALTLWRFLACLAPWLLRIPQTRASALRERCRDVISNLVPRAVPRYLPS